MIQREDVCADVAVALSSWLRVGLGVYVRARGRACVRACVPACVRACARSCVRACVRAGMDVAVALGTCLHAWV